MGIIAGFLVQNTLKYLLQFGQVTNYLGYSALNDFFPIMNLKPNPNCDDSYCKLRQKEYAEKPKIEKAEEVFEDTTPLHEDNEWGISLVDESATIEDKTSVGEGVSYAYSLPSQEQASKAEAATEDISLDELMAQMKTI